VSGPELHTTRLCDDWRLPTFTSGAQSTDCKSNLHEGGVMRKGRDGKPVSETVATRSEPSKEVSRARQPRTRSEAKSRIADKLPSSFRPARIDSGQAPLRRNVSSLPTNQARTRRRRSESRASSPCLECSKGPRSQRAQSQFEYAHKVPL